MQYLYCHNARKVYFLVVESNESIRCSICQKVIELGRTIVIHKSYSRFLPMTKKYYCLGCAPANKKSELDSFNSARITCIIPENSSLVLDSPPRLTDAKDITVFNTGQIISEKTKDNTVYSGRNSIEGAMIGDKKYLHHDKEKNKNLGYNQLLIELDNHKKCT